MKQDHEYKMEIPNMIKSMSRTKEGYVRWVKHYFRAVHPNLKLVRIEKKFAILKKDDGL